MEHNTSTSAAPALTPTAIWGAIVRERRWVALVTVGISIAVLAIAARMPDRYTSIATLVVVQQQVSTRYVDPATLTTATEALATIKREIMSRRRVLRMLEDSGLYPAGGTSLQKQDALVESMQRDIVIEPVGPVSSRSDLNAFTVSYTARTPALAQDITKRVTAMFAEEQSKTRGEQAAVTAQFLTEQLALAKQRMEAKEIQLREFRTKYQFGQPAGETGPDTELLDLRAQNQTNTSTAARLQQQRVSLESSLSSVLTRQQNERSRLLERVTVKHPSVIRLDGEIAMSTGLLGRLRGETIAKTSPPSDVPPEDPVVSQLVVQVDAYAAEMKTLVREERRVRNETAAYQRRVQLAPLRDQELSGLQRDYEIDKQAYTDLLGKQIRSQMTASVEERLEGQQFRLIEPPSLPRAPSGPKRVLFGLAGIGAGLVIGLGLAILLDSRKAVIRSERQMQRAFALPIVMAVPFIATPAEIRRGAKLNRIEWAVGAILSIILIAAEILAARASV